MKEEYRFCPRCSAPVSGSTNGDAAVSNTQVVSGAPAQTSVLNSQEAPASKEGGYRLYVFEGGNQLLDVDLNRFGKEELSFGRDPGCDIPIQTQGSILSRRHGTFIIKDGVCTVKNESRNGILVNGRAVSESKITANDVVSVAIESRIRRGKRGGNVHMHDPEHMVTFVLGSEGSDWTSVPLRRRERPYTIGR